MAEIYCCCEEANKHKCNDAACDKHAKLHPTHTCGTCWPKNKLGEKDERKDLQ